LGGVGDRIEIRDPVEGTRILSVIIFIKSTILSIEIRDPVEGTRITHIIAPPKA
jgi:hypothetical protein